MVVATDSSTCPHQLSIGDTDHCHSQEYHLPYASRVSLNLTGLTPYATDLAKTSPHVVHPERFALHLGTYLVSKYAHIHKAFVTVEQLKWKRIDVNGQEHKHSFWRDGDEKRVVQVEVSSIHSTVNVSADPED